MHEAPNGSRYVKRFTTRTVTWVTFFVLSLGPCLSPGLVCGPELLNKKTYTQRDLAEPFLAVHSFWEQYFRNRGWKYEPMEIQFYDEEAKSPCDTMTRNRGPMYCPKDRTLWLDLEFFRERREKLGPLTPAFLAYVMAHEYGHHVQTLRLVFDTIQAQGPAAYGADVKPEDFFAPIEYQADCLAGFFLRAQERLKRFSVADLADLLDRNLGDDTAETLALKPGWQFASKGSHGSSVGRRIWLKQGLTSDKIEACEPLEFTTLN